MSDKFDSWLNGDASAAIVIRDCKGKYDGPIETCSGKANGRAGVIPGGTRGGIR